LTKAGTALTISYNVIDGFHSDFKISNKTSLPSARVGKPNY